MAVTAPYSTVISPNDHMWKSGRPWYFDVGLSALDCIRRALATVEVTPASILDLPCGHGRVCRMLRMAFPSAHLTVSDLDHDGVDFCAEQFAAEALYSQHDIGKVTTARAFDLIWCGSLFTHLERSRWADFLGFFSDHLSTDGVLVFTTHGRRPIQWMTEGVYSYGLTAQERRQLLGDYSAKGFGFVSPDNQAFGISLSSPAVVCSAIEQCHTLRLIGLQEAGWSNHQDVFACVKLSTPFPDPSSCPVPDDVVPADQGRAPLTLDRPIGHLDMPDRDVTVNGPLRLQGWAADYRGIREVQARLNGQIVAVTVLNWERPDVSAVYPELYRGSHGHGFGFDVDRVPPGVHTLSVHAVNIDGVSADLGTRTVTVPAR